MKEQFRIGKMAQYLGVKRFVIRFWEKEFGISAQRTSGGQRFYDQKDFEQFKLIKELLYEKGFTITGAKKVLNQEIKNTAYVSERNVPAPQNKISNNKMRDQLSVEILEFQKQLIKLRDLL